MQPHYRRRLFPFSLGILMFVIFFIASCQKAPEASTFTSPNTKSTSVTAQPTTVKDAGTPIAGKSNQPILSAPTPTFATTFSEKILLNGDRGMIVLNPDGTDAISISEPMAREDSDPSLSPDGSKIVFGGKDGEIYVRSIDKSELTNLTNFPGQDRHPIWSPDGTKIAFESARQDHFGIYIREVDMGANQVTTKRSKSVRWASR